MLNEIIACVKNGGKILIAGNGGLAAEAEHFAAELMGQFAFEAYAPCIALTTNSSLITALANDIGYSKVFSHQVAILGKKGDLFIGMTTTRSKNILDAIEVAQNKGLYTVLLDGAALKGNNVMEKQESAIYLLHRLAYDVKKELALADCQSQ